MLLHVPRLIHAQQARIRVLAGPGILAAGLADLFGLAHDVKDIIGNLKRKPDRFPVVAASLELFTGSAAEDRPQQHRGGDERARLMPCI